MYKFPTNKIAKRERFTLDETIEWLKQFYQGKYEVNEDGITICGDLVYSLKTMYFPLYVKAVTGSLTVKNAGITNDLSSLPRFIGGSLVLTGNAFQCPSNFPTFDGDLDLSSNKNLNDLSGLNLTTINGDLFLINCGFSKLDLGSIEKICGSLNASENKIRSITTTAEITGDLVLTNNLMTYEPTLDCKGTMFLDGNPVNPDDQLEKSMWG